MFVYLSKKIAIPNNVKLNCIAWNKEHGYIAVAGSEGLLKVLKLEQASSGPNKGNLAAVSNLSMNQTLDGHKEGVKVVTWNETQQKLTSSDLDGVIMVWMIYKGSWYEEMTNDRKKSTVNSMSWTSDGAKICIVYEDGAIIVGSVDGNRIWGKELKNTHLTSVQWSPDNRLILFGLANGECHLYDNQGNFAMKLNIQCVSLSPNRNFRISALCWYSGRAPSNRPVLAICFETCKLQIMRNEIDDAPVIIDTGMRNIDAEWNQDGSVLSVCGTLIDYSTSKESNQVNFYSPFGQLIRILKVPGNEISSLSWEGKSLRIAMAVDSFIYFANIRPDYMWCYFEKTVVFLNKNNTNHIRNSTTNVITFWNTLSNQSFLKEVEPALGMAACSEYCVLAVECLNSNMKENIITDAKNQNQNDDKCYQLMLCNSIGTTVDSKYTDMKPNFIGINSGHVTIASFDEVLIWHYNTPKSAANLHGAKGRKENRFHIDDTPTGVEMAKDLVIATGGASGDRKAYKQHVNIDPICALAMSEKILLVARSSGIINEYSVPNVALRNRHKINATPHKLAINCNSSRAAVIDDVGVMTLLDLEDDRQSQVNFNRVERKDVWAVCWAKDNPLLLALMEKTRMYVFRGNDPEEPISCSGYICAFEDLEITSVLLDDIISGDETQNSVNHIIQLRVKSLRDTDDLLQHVGLEDAKQFIEDNPHPRLWRLLAEAALKKLELGTAENAFVRCANYQGIQLIKRMRNITTPMLQKAEVAAFYGEFEEAEKLYMDADRRDLAINLRITLCDWFRAVQLYRMGSGVSDQQMEIAWREIGNHFASLRSWESAKEYYEKSHHLEGLMDALYHLERFDELDQCIDKLPEKSPLLAKIAEMLASVGMCTEAVKAYLKMGDPKSAVNACVNLRQWGEAVQLARKFDMPQIGELLCKHATQLIKEDRLPEAIELQKKAGFYLEAARLLGKLAQREAEKDTSMLRIKKLYILAGLLSEEHLKSLSTAELSYKVDRNSILDTMSPEDAHVVEHMWHAAEAYHFMMLAQRQLRFGIAHSAVVTALRLCDYDDILPAEDVYNILALSCCADRSFGTCVKAFTKLEGLENIPECRVHEYKQLAESIFSKYTTEDTKNETVKCYACNSPVPDSLPVCTVCGARFPACVSSGKPITQPTSNIWICGICHHCAAPVEISRHHTCPLCHSLIISMTLEI
ncbi:WD repeat-containing protein 35 [Zeugodacus cucurbitae]|uniref:WD repeat-containing protein 35 n=1 Tax=Zeugodacus cucurbitae TaxID=28588 RepID=A0A0A1X1P4_ZEUCU|nr:WD repeat-containing protein 35 [Zeugodacus cucurbitae]